MSMKWKQLGYGSGAIVAAMSTVFALSPSEKNRGSVPIANDEKTSTSNSNHNHLPGHVGNQIRTPFLTKEEILQEAIRKSRQLCKRLKTELGLPGLTVGVTVNGKMVWQEGFGFSSLESQTRMKPENIMRIASISKSMTMAMLAKLMEEGKIDIDKPIQTYLPSYPEKYVDGEKVTITTRHLLSHLSGIRHYNKKESKNKNEENPEDENMERKKGSKNAEKKPKKEEEEMSKAEYFLKDKFASVEESMKLFQDDELFHKPGTKFMYTTHGWTVVSAIIEKLTETEFTKHSTRMFDYWGLKNTRLDLHEPIIYNRACYYTRMKDGVIQNAPYVDNSYKWAGGGFLSNVADLNKFANILIFSMQTPDDAVVKLSENGLPKIPYLKQSTMKKMWTGDPLGIRDHAPDYLYALGFIVGEPLRKCMFCKERDLMTVLHSGAAIGASSMLLMAFPVQLKKDCDQTTDDVKGVTVAMITNLTSIGLSKTAHEIASNFQALI